MYRHPLRRMSWVTIMSRLFVGFVCTLTLISVTECGLATDDVTLSDDERQFADPSAELRQRSIIFLNNHRSGVDSVASGIVRIHESSKRSSGHTEADIFLAFDRTNDRLRYDYRRVGDPLGVSLFARNDEECLHSQPTMRSVGRYPRDWSGVPHHGRPLDVRCVGVYSQSAVSARFSIGKFRSMMEEAVNPSVQSVREEGNLISIKWNVGRSESSRVFLEIVYDREQGSMPVRHREVYFNPTNGSISQVQVSTTEWELRSEVWVPRTWRMEDKSDGDIDEFTFNWESVNAPVPKSIFQLESFDLPNGVTIWNHRVGEVPVNEGIIGQAKRVSSERAATPPDSQGTTRDASVFNWLNISIASLALLAVLLRRAT